MSLLLNPSHRAASLAYLRTKCGSVRFLGNQARGPPVQDAFGQLQYARALLHRPGITYDTYKQQCESFRLFLFYGVCGILTLDMLLRPPKSSYWNRWRPTQLLKTIAGEFFTYGTRSVLYNSSDQSNTEGWDAYKELVASKDKKRKHGG